MQKCNLNKQKAAVKSKSGHLWYHPTTLVHLSIGHKELKAAVALAAL